MSDTSRISKRQLFILIFLSRAILLLGDTGFLGVKINAAEYAISSAAGIVILCIISCVIGKSKIEGRVQDGNLIKILSFIIFALALIETAFTLKKLFENMYSELTPVIIALLITAFVVYLSLKHGVEGIARLSFVAAVIIIASLVFTLVPNAVNFEALRISSVYDVSGVGICAAFIKQFIFLPEIALLIILSKSANESVSVKGAIKLYILLAAVTALFYVFYEGVLGGGVYLDRLSISALSQAGEFSIFRRVEAMRLSLWIVAALTRLSLYGAGLSFILNKSKINVDKTRTIITSIIVFAAILVSCFIGNGYIDDFLYIGISSFVLLLLITVLACMFRRRSDV